jgi:cytochrome P450
MAETNTDAATCPVFPLERDPDRPLDPSPEFDRLVSECPFSRVRTWSGDEVWLISRFDDLRAALNHPDISSDATKPGFPVYTEAAQHVTKGFMPHLDGEEHTALRRKVIPEFRVKRIDALRPQVQEIVDGLIDAMDATGTQSADLVEDFALASTTLMICAMLGVPYSDRDVFQESVAIGFKIDTTPAESAAASKRFVDYLDALIRGKEETPSDDMFGRLADFVRSGEMTHEELLNLGRFLVIAGFETTANTMVLGVTALLEHPDQLADLLANPDLVPNAVEEILRYTMITQSGRRRLAVADIEVAGHTIKAGEGFIATQDGANRDPSAFPDPHRFDIRRKAHHHVTFGFGPHACAGAPLGRMELQVVFGTLLQRIPSMRLGVPLQELPFKYDGQVYGLYHMPVEWDEVLPRIER